MAVLTPHCGLSGSASTDLPRMETVDALLGLIGTTCEHTHTRRAALHVDHSLCNAVNQPVNRSGEDALKQPRRHDVGGMSRMSNSLIVSWRKIKVWSKHTHQDTHFKNNPAFCSSEEAFSFGWIREERRKMI